MLKRFAAGILVIVLAIHSGYLIAEGINSRALTHKAIQLSVKGNLEKALIIFQEIVEKEPNNLYALNNLGKTYLDLNKIDDAIASFQKALAINPGFWMAENNLADAYKRAGNYKQAEILLKKVLKNFSTFELANANLGEIYLSQKRYDEAIIYLKKAVETMPTAAKYHLLLAKAFQGKNLHKEADKEIGLYNQLKKNQ